MSSFPSLSYVCPIRWDEMRGDERERFCSRCHRTVVNLSLLTATERADLLARTPPDQLCVSYYRRLNGEFVSAEQPLTPAESRSAVQLGVAALSLGALAFAAECLPEAGPVLRQTGTELQAKIERTRDEIIDDAQHLLARVTGRPPPVPAATLILGMIICPPSAPGPSAPPASPPLPAVQAIPPSANPPGLTPL